MSSVSDLPVSAGVMYKKGATIGMDATSSTADLTWRVPDADILRFMQVVGGLSESISLGGTPPRSITRIIPLRHPKFPNLLANQAQAEGVGFDATTHWWASWDVKVHFSTPQFALDGNDPFLTISFAPSSRTVPVVASGATFAGDSSHPVHDPGIWLPGYTYNVQINNLPTFDETAYQGLLNKCNSTVFRGNPIGTVKYGGVAGQKTFTLGNVQRCTVTHTFEVSSLDWNKEFKADGSTDTLNVNGSVRYPTTDLNTIFNS